MRPLPAILLVGGGLAVGVLIGRVWGQSARTFESERVIGQEIELLERAKSTPSCEGLRAASAGSGEERVNELRVLWRRVPGTEKVQRLVVSPALDFAYEEATVSCAP
jgi:hypothetical protein